MEDTSGNPYVNTAGQPFPDRDYHVTTGSVLVARKNYKTLDEVWAINKTYYKTTNSTAWGFASPAKTWRYMGTRTTEPKFEDGIKYYEGISRFEFRGTTDHPFYGTVGGWEQLKISKGWAHRKIGGGNQPLVTPVGDDGLPLAEPILLKASGLRLAPGDTPFTQRFEVLKPLDYNGIGVGT